MVYVSFAALMNRWALCVLCGDLSNELRIEIQPIDRINRIDRIDFFMFHPVNPVILSNYWMGS